VIEHGFRLPEIVFGRGATVTIFLLIAMRLL
jgi:hypothetical protein